MNAAEYEDLVGRDEDAGRDDFDGREFEHRASWEESHYWHVHRRRVIRGELQAFAAPRDCGRLVEIGCGIGTVATHLNQHGYEVDYSDIFGRALRLARARAREKLGAAVERRRFVRLDAAERLPIDAYTGALLFDVIEHLPDDERVMRNVRAALGDRAGAFVMVTVPAFRLLWSPWDDVEKHKRRYTRGELEDLLRRTGFEVARTTYFFGPLFFAALAMKGLRTVRSALRGQAPARDISELTESANVAVLNRLMLGVLEPERLWLGRGELPFGTSILAIARAR
jgi:SAM-dependent methyltransferase